MADSPEPGESLIKKEAGAAGERSDRQPLHQRLDAGLALLLTISIAWALYDEAFGQRPWKGMQQEFVSRYTRYLDSIKANAGKTRSRNQGESRVSATRRGSESRREAVQAGDTTRSTPKSRASRRKLDAITDPFQNQRGRLTVINYNVETANGSAKERYRRQAEEKSAGTGRRSNCLRRWQVDRNADVQLRCSSKKLYDELREEKAQALGEKAELLKTPSELGEETRRLSEEPPDRTWSGRDRRSEDQDGQLRLLDPRPSDQRQRLQHRRPLRSLPRRHS